MKKIDYHLLKPIWGRSDGVKLIPIADSDTDDIVRWRNQEFIKKCFIYREPFSKQLHRKWMEEKVKTGDVIQYIIQDTKDSISIGSIYIRDIDYQKNSGELGIFIGEKSRLGQGIGKKATEMLTDFCFSNGFHRIFARVLSDNSRSINHFKKSGFSVEGVAKDMEYLDGEYKDVVFLSKINMLD